MRYAALFAAVGCLTAGVARSAGPALTIYNQDFAIVREPVALQLKAGVNRAQLAGTATYLEPSSVVLRDPSGRHQFQILEQNFRADPVSQEMLLALNEGKTIEFEVVNQEGGQTRREQVRGKIIRSGYAGGSWANGRFIPGGNMTMQPIIEVGGKLRFSLPGQPLFPSLADETILKPTLLWVIESDNPANFDAEISYATGGMKWESDYNLVLPERGNTLDLVGWITIENQSGKPFKDARIELMAGDVNKVQRVGGFSRQGWYGGGGGGGGGAPPVKERSFDEYHLYTLERQTTLLDQERKQVEFVRASGVKSVPLYVYDGAAIDTSFFFGQQRLVMDSGYGTACNKKVQVMREFTNSAANHLGLPLPKGTVRFYRNNTSGQMEFIGENVLEHTPRDEVVRLSTGIAFDLVGERKQTSFKMFRPPAQGVVVDPATGIPYYGGSVTNESVTPWADESFEIRLRNHKTEKIEVRVLEHLYRWVNWDITDNSLSHRKVDAQTIEFPVELGPDAEQILAYTVHYWGWP